MTDKQANLLGSEKTILGFVSDVLFLKGVVCYEEYEAMQAAKSHEDVNEIVEGMLRSSFNQFKRGVHHNVKVEGERA